MSDLTHLRAVARNVGEDAVISARVRRSPLDSYDDDDDDRAYTKAYMRTMAKLGGGGSYAKDARVRMCAELDLLDFVRVDTDDAERLVGRLASLYTGVEDKDYADDYDDEFGFNEAYQNSKSADAQLALHLPLLSPDALEAVAAYCADGTPRERMLLRRMRIVGTPDATRARFVASGMQHAMEQGTAQRPALPRVLADVVGQLATASITHSAPVRTSVAQLQRVANRQAELARLCAAAATMPAAGMVESLKRLLAQTEKDESDAKRQRQ